MSDKELPVAMPASAGRHCQWAPNMTNEGGNLTGHDEFDLQPYEVPSFMGMSGQGNNQATDRAKGST